jgi:hypothetical protein
VGVRDPLPQLAEEIAAFNGVPVDVVLGDLLRDLAGEDAALRKYGINLTDEGRRARIRQVLEQTRTCRG